MFTKFRAVLVFLLVNFVILTAVNPALACGPFTLDPVFGFTRHGEYPLSEYSDGKLGLIPDSYGRISLFVFYRYLNDMPLTKMEAKEAARAIRNRIGMHPTDTANADSGGNTLSPYEQWDELSATIRTPLTEPDKFKSYPSSYRYFRNCLDGAYLTATETLSKRIGSKYAEKDIEKWVRGQDAVFSNCGDGAATMPETVGPDAPLWLQQDRVYQQAAALFYKAEFGDARNAFEVIARDKSSVWAKTANYLTARTLIREASFIDDDDTTAVQNAEVAQKKRQLHLDAIVKLDEILEDPQMKEFHNSAGNLLGLVKYRLDPVARTVELAQKLSNKSENKNLYNDLTDYIWLLDKVEDEGEAESERNPDRKQSDDDSWGYEARLRDIPESKRVEDLTDWLITYQANDGFEHAFEEWKTTKKPHWLAAAIIKTKGADQSAGTLVDAANEIPSSSTAFATVIYHAIRIAREAGNSNRATQLTEKVFDAGLDRFPASTKNSFYAQRIGSARNLSEFLKYAKRRPTAFLWSDDFNEAGEDRVDLENLSPWKERQMFGEDAVRILNANAPLSVWLKAANNDEVPDYLRDFVASAGWTRAFMLEDKRHERLFAPLVAKYSRDYSPLFKKYTAARTVRDREAAALIVLGRYPVMEPFIPARWGRKWNTAATTIDSNRGNWWCIDDDESSDGQKPNFLSAAETKNGQQEFAKLRTLGHGATGYAARSVEFAKQNPRHRSTPEILHLAVRATRYGCKDDQTGKFSKQAFDLLHRRYRNSAWTRRTPFWFG